MDPVRVTKRLLFPAMILLGDSEVSVGTGLLTVKVSAFEAPPPGAGLKTVTGLFPAKAMAVAGTVAVKVALLTKSGVSANPLK